MSDDDFRTYIDELLNDPVKMAELLKQMEESIEKERQIEFEYQLQQRRSWDEHKHDTYY